MVLASRPEMGHTETEVLRPIIGTFITVLAGVRMLLTPNQTRLDAILDWIWPVCGVALVLLLMCEVVQRWHPADRIYRWSIRKREAEAKREINDLWRSPCCTPVDYDPRTGVITAGLGIKRTWKRRVAEAVLWLANRRLLPRWFTITMMERLGWKYRSQSA